MRALTVAILFCVLALPAFAAPVPAGFQVVSEATVRGVISDYVMQKAQALNARVSVKRIGFHGDLKLPQGRLAFEVVAPDRWEGYGNGTVALVVRVDDQVKRNQTVFVEVEALTEMVVATRTLERGEVLTASDLALVPRDMAQVYGRYMKDTEEAVGLRVKTAVRANTPLRKDYLERVPVVKSGQVVTMVAENDAVRITATGKAKGAGALGDTIMVQNLSSHRDVPARVVDSTTVQVDF